MTLKQCKNCLGQYARHLDICPHCGHLETESNREARPLFKRWQIQVYVLGVLMLGLVLGVWASSDSARFIPELVSDAAPIMLILGAMYYGYTRHELKEADKSAGASVTVAGNWYLASVALVVLIIGGGLLLIDKNRTAFEIALTADILALVVFATHPVTNVWRRHS